MVVELVVELVVGLVVTTQVLQSLTQVFRVYQQQILDLLEIHLAQVVVDLGPVVMVTGMEDFQEEQVNHPLAPQDLLQVQVLQ